MVEESCTTGGGARTVEYLALGELQCRSEKKKALSETLHVCQDLELLAEKASNGMPFLFTMRSIPPQIVTTICHRLGIDHIVQMSEWFLHDFETMGRTGEVAKQDVCLKTALESEES